MPLKSRKGTVNLGQMGSLLLAPLSKTSFAAPVMSSGFSMPASHLSWLPQNMDWNDEFRSAGAAATVEWDALVRLANFQMDLLRTERLDSLARRKFGNDQALPATDIRLAVLGSS